MIYEPLKVININNKCIYIISNYMRVYMLSVACVGLSCYPCMGLAMGKLWCNGYATCVQG